MSRIIARSIWVLTAAAGLVLAGGCGERMPLMKSFQLIDVGSTDSATVMSLLPQESLMHTEDAVSALTKKGSQKELGVVRFQQTDSMVQRKNYLLMRAKLTVPPFSEQQFYLFIEALVPAEVLDAPYADEQARSLAILRYGHETLVKDGKDFSQDQDTLGLIGMARTALGVGIHEVTSRPREAYLLTSKQGFDFVHPVMGKSRMFLKADAEKPNLYTLQLIAKDTVDAWDLW